MKIEEIFKIEKKDFGDYSFLKPLLDIHKPPEQLYYKGILPIKNKNTKVVSIIGSRKMTQYGKDVIFKIIHELSGRDIIIISGLALGCDSEAHKQSIKNNLITVAFPGSGIKENVLYPQTNINLARSIIESSGAVVSEFEPDEKSALWTFPARNRVLAGVSDFVLIVEAESKSGTQITARLALEYGKDIGIIPGSIFSIYSKGTVGLWKDGAYPITCGQDIIEILGIDNMPQQQELFDIDNTNIAKSHNNKNINIYNNLSEDEKSILSLLNCPVYKEELLEKCMALGMSFDLILTTLITLESKGIIKDNFEEIKKII